MVPPCFTPATTGALWSTGILPRADGRSRRGLCLWQSAAPLRDHLPQSLPYPFPPFRALCAVSLWLLFSSSRLRALFSSAWVALSLQPEGAPVNRIFCTKKRGRQSNCFAAPSKIHMPPGLRLSRLICRLTFRRSFLRPARLVMRWSVRVAREVPSDWKICTKITIKTTAMSITA